MFRLEDILRRAAEAGASDVHLSAGSEPKMRVNGILVPLPGEKLTAGDTNSIVYSIMNESQHNCFEEQGAYNLAYTIEGQSRYRVHVYKRLGTAALVFRLIPAQIPGLQDLGLPGSVQELCGLSRGLVLVTGPMGSGRSTTLASLVKQMGHSRSAHIITLEEPVEFLYPAGLSLVDQRDVGTDSLGYARALKAALREDPDVILVGDLPDPETVLGAIMAAEAGCLVLSALHVAEPAGAVEYLAGLFPVYGQMEIRRRLAGVLEGILAQRLLPGAEGQGRRAEFELLRMDAIVRRRIQEGQPL